MRLQCLHALLVRTDHVLVILRGVLLDEHLNQLRHIFEAFAQRRQLDGEDVQAIVAVGALRILLMKSSLPSWRDLFIEATSNHFLNGRVGADNPMPIAGVAPLL
jgi:hypothetical protein